MKRFLHSIGKVMIVDGDDVRRAPMAAALLQHFANHNQTLRLWGTKVESAGTGKSTKADATPVCAAQHAMLKKGLDISSHKARTITLRDILGASLVLTMESKHADYLKQTTLDMYPSCARRTIPQSEYLGIPDKEVPRLLGAKLSEYTKFADWVESVMGHILWKFRQETILPLVLKGVGLGSGFARGPVRIVGDVSQADEVQKGDVVVCATNHVKDSYGRGVEAAAAIVTDSGSEAMHLSQLCHELDIPCVAETSYATSTLHNRDLVIVDATMGLVYHDPTSTLGSFQAQVSEGKELLRGISGSAGIAVGKVRIIQGDEDIMGIQPGEILVADKLKSPTMKLDLWASYVKKGAAFVQGAAGVASSACILAMEWGKPCLCGIHPPTKQSCTTFLKNGQMVVVEGFVDYWRDAAGNCVLNKSGELIGLGGIYEYLPGAASPGLPL